MKISAFNLSLWLLCVTVILFLLAPPLVVAISSFSSTEFLKFPPEHLSLRWHAQFWQNEAWSAAISNSLKVGILASIASVLVSIFVLTATHKFGRPVRLATLAFFALPMAFPPIVMALSQLQFFDQYGLDRGILRLATAHLAICISVSYTLLYSIFNGPLVIQITTSIDLSKSMIITLTRVIIPLLSVQTLGAFVVAFLISFDEPVISQMLATPGVETVPQKTYNSIRYDIAPDAAVLTFYIMLLWACLGIFVASLNSGSGTVLDD